VGADYGDDSGLSFNGAIKSELQSAQKRLKRSAEPCHPHSRMQYEQKVLTMSKENTATLVQE